MGIVNVILVIVVNIVKKVSCFFFIKKNNLLNLASCPVLCSGNGVFNNGKCVCHEGFKGLECELISNWYV